MIRKIVVHTILETINCSRLMMFHQDSYKMIYSIIMSQDYYLQARERGPTYKFMLHFYAHE